MVRPRFSELLARARYGWALGATVLLNLRGLGLELRSVCAPGFNCHGCPWATCACPIGVLTFGAAVHSLPAFALGSVLATGALLGRLVCGFACPFGLLQDVLFRVPCPKFPLPRWTRYLKYVALGALVFLLPYLLGFEASGYLRLSGQTVDKAPEGRLKLTVTVENLGAAPVVGPVLRAAYRDKVTGRLNEEASLAFAEVAVPPGLSVQLPAFELQNRLVTADLVLSSPQSVPTQTPRYRLYYCKWCPAGTLTASLPASLSHGSTRPDMWERNGPRLAVLVLFLVLMVLVSRPFCRTFCPLGASYGLLSRAALCRVEVDLTACVRCRRCDRVCPVDLDVAREVGGPECIACGDCIRACPQNGIHRTYGLRTPAPGRTTLNPAPASACEGATHVA